MVLFKSDIQKDLNVTVEEFTFHYGSIQIALPRHQLP